MTGIDLDRLVDPKSLNGGHYTFLAFPRDSVRADGLPVDLEAQEYIAAIQSAGIPVGIWIDTPTKDASHSRVPITSMRCTKRWRGFGNRDASLKATTSD